MRMAGLRRSGFLGSLVLILVLLGLATRRGELLALAVPILIFLIAGIYPGPEAERVRLRANRSLSRELVHGGEPVRVVVEVTNAGGRLEMVELVDESPSSLEVIEGNPKAIASLGPGASLTLEYTVIGDRGLFEFESVRAVVGRHFGFKALGFRLDCPGRLAILPDVEGLGDIEIRPRRTRVYSGSVPAREGGVGVEFFGTRAYQPGDEFRWINWKATARRDRLVTNEFEQERVADVAVILDAREMGAIQVGSESLFEHAVRATASLAGFFLRRGNRVGLLIYGRYLDWTFPGYGREQEHRVVSALAKAQPGGSEVFKRLENIPVRLFPRGSQIVIVSPVLREDLSVYQRLRAREYQVIVVSPNPIDFELAHWQDGSDVVRLAERITRLQREVNLNRLRRMGVRVVDWCVERPLHAEVNRTLSRRLR
ncbi:MAG: DUF58 domain-containing protein [Candidatus Bipolaricaulia bacterium]